MNINHYPNKSFTLIFYPYIFRYNFKIDLNQSVKERLKESEVLTNALALKIFKRIKLKSDILSFLTKPIVFIPLSIAVSTAGLAIPFSGVALTALKIVLCLLGGSMLGISLRELSKHFLSQVSRAYSDQSLRASEYIRNLKASDKEVSFTFA